MPEGLGLQGYLGLAFQSAVGTTQTSSIHWLPILSETLTEDIAVLESRELRTRYNEPLVQQGLRAVAGDVIMEVDPHTIGALLHAAYGRTDTTSDTGKQLHQFIETTSAFSERAPLQPFTVIVHRDVGSAFHYYDMYADQLTLDFSVDEYVKATLSLTGGAFKQAAAVTTSFYPEALSPKIPWTACSMSLAGAAEDRFTSFQWKMENNIEVKGTLSSSYSPTRAKRSDFRKQRVSATMEFENLTEFDKWRSNSAQGCTINALTADGSYLRLILDALRWDTLPANISGPGAISVGVGGRCENHVGNSRASTAWVNVTSTALLNSNSGWLTYGNGSVA